MKDPIVEEVRKFRKEHTQKFHGELSEICADLRRVQVISGHDIIRLAPRRVAPNQSSGPKRSRGR